MALFQEAIVKNYISKLDPEKVDKAFSEFKNIYSEANIKIYKKIKEEAHQGEFIEDIFGKVLGYQRHSDIKREYKNENDAKKADAAILKEDNVVGVIELKDNKTKNLSDVQAQAFNYKVNHKNCSYVITSNFHKLRFYIDDTTDYEEFDLYNLDKESFRRFYLYLQREGLLEKNLPKLLRQETKFHEEEISKNLYKDYSNFKRSFFENALKNNPQFDKLTLFKKSQKFLDRVLFVLFAEDKGLVTTNSVVQIVEKWQALRDDAFDTPRPLYTLVLLFFNNLYLGKKDNKGTVLIPEFGGELFAPDEVLDQLTIDDDVLKDDLLKLSKYDFNTDVDVNILGHIFEHSLNEVDDVEAELRGEKVDKTKSKRKKDGVFYTPKYITKYIVDNTLGKLCSEKKSELKLDIDIFIDDFQKTDGKLNEKGKDLFARLNTYKAWLLTVKVCDPACGSGAFLNQALSFFIDEHKFVDDLIAELTNSPLRLFDTDLQILENNIYGVDINEESVEIAKLSMWLRTAQPGRKLSNLSNNIKCGNSLIDDPEVAGDNAFSWEKEFPTVFEKGGFDVVIGNPPYGATLENNVIQFIESHYKSFEYQVNSYVTFYEKGIGILRENGMLGYITPATFTYQHYFKKIRAILLEWSILNISKYFYEVFDDADIGDSVSWIIQKKKNRKEKISVLKCLDKQDAITKFSDLLEYNDIVNDDNTFNLDNSKLDIQRLMKKGTPLGEICQIVVGIKPYQVGKGKPKQSRETVSTKIFTDKYKKDNTYISCIIGKDFNRYRYIHEPQMYLSYGEWLAEPREIAPFFDDEKIILRQTADSLIGVIDNKQRINLNNVYNIARPKFATLRYILALFNSKLLNLIYQNISQEKGRLFAEVKKVNLERLPIIIDDNRISAIEENVNKLLFFNDCILENTEKFKRYISSQINGPLLNTKLLNWPNLEFSEFIKELNKELKNSSKSTLTKQEEIEWMDVFEIKKKEIFDLQSQIDQSDKEIDHMVYELYGLTEEEIQIVENS